MARRNIRVRPGRAQSTMGFVVGILFVLIGVAVVIPSAGLFGLLWTGVAVAITVMNGLNAFGKKGVPTMEIYSEEEDCADDDGQDGPTAQQRLEELQSLYDRRLITTEEYEAKRAEILKQL